MEIFVGGGEVKADRRSTDITGRKNKMRKTLKKKKRQWKILKEKKGEWNRETYELPRIPSKLRLLMDLN